MFGSSLGYMALRKVCDHRTIVRGSVQRPSRVRRAAVSLPFQVDRLKVLVEAGLVAFSSACFEFAQKVPKEAQHGSLAHLPNIFASHLHSLSEVAVMGFCA